MALWLAVTACGGGDVADGDEVRASTGGLPGPVCGLLDRLDTHEEALEAPEVFALDEAALADVLAARRETLAELVDETEGELQALLEKRAHAQPAIDGAMLDGWDEDRARFVDEHIDDGRWSYEQLVGPDARRDDGEAIDIPEYWRTTQKGYDRLVVGCRAPELIGGPEQETSEDPPPGRLVSLRPPSEEAAGEGGRLVMTTERGTDARDLALAEIPGASDNPREWVATGWTDASPTPDPRILVNVVADDEYAMVAVALDGTIVDFVQRSTVGPVACPAWDARGERVLDLEDSPRADERRVVLVDLTGATPSGLAPLPFATASCGDFVTEDRIVVSHAALDIEDPRAVWTVGTDGSDPRELYRPTADDCTTQVGGVDPEGMRVALAQTCDDPLGNGIVVVDLTTGASQRVATGLAALPKWSPDGEWLVFGYAPLGEGAAIGTWVARPDGRQLRQVLESPAWFPAWLPPDRT